LVCPLTRWWESMILQVVRMSTWLANDYELLAGLLYKEAPTIHSHIRGQVVNALHKI